ncbi:MAG: sterol-binding protein [Betaproteobacteria bacterium]|nr:sterol-binding protein [Betaproteobacteria bacterium]
MDNALTVPKFRLPGFVAAMGQHLPQWPHALALIAGLNAALAFKLLPAGELATLEDKQFRVRVLDSGGEASFTYRNGRFLPIFRPTREPDLAFAANLSAFLQLLARQEDPDTLFFNRELEITGDTELGLLVKNLLDAVEWPAPPRLGLPLGGR